MLEVTQFHNLSHIFISLIGGTLLLAIYYNIRNRFRSFLEEGDTNKRLDKGLLYLSLSMFVWVISGLWAFLSFSYAFHQDFIFHVGVNLLSIVNNMFLLLAISYFNNAPAFIYKHDKNIRIIIGIIILVTLVTICVSYFFGDQLFYGIKLSAIPDLFLSAFLSYLLLISLHRTFSERSLPVVAFISSIVILLIFLSQFPNAIPLFENEFASNLIRIIAKTSLISIFLVLAASWVIELANTPKVKEIQISFLDWSLVKLTIPSKDLHEEVLDFGSKTTQYKNLLKFGIRRKYASGDAQCIEVGSAGEIKSQTYLSRIIENIEEIRTDQSTEKLARKDLFTFIGEGKYRLRILPEHISFDNSLLQEFLASEKGYKDVIK